MNFATVNPDRSNNMSVIRTIQAVVAGSMTVEAAASALAETRAYALTYMQYHNPDLDVEWKNTLPVGGEDLDQYRAEIAAWNSVRQAALPLIEPLNMGDSFTVCNGCL